MTFSKFENGELLAEKLAAHVAVKLQEAVDASSSASLAVSGGNTPKRFFEKLSQIDIEWNAVTITLVDERWVPADHERSNAKLVKTHLLQNAAAEAQFYPLHCEGKFPDVLEELGKGFKSQLPFDVVILGMGGDGHTASFFPSGSKLDDAVSTDTNKILIDMEAPVAGEPRVTFTLPSLISAKELILHIEGEEKLDVLKTAKQNGPANELPIRHVLNHKRDLDIYWAP